MISDQPSVSISVEIREVLFGDEPLEKVASYGAEASGEGGSVASVPTKQGVSKVTVFPERSEGKHAQTNPWVFFTAASLRLAAGDSVGAIETLQKILTMSGLEARIYLQAWHCLLALGKHPTTELAREVQGVVVEVALGDGLDIVAVYADGSARYINYSGAAIIWDVADAEIDKLMMELLDVGQSTVDVSAPWDGPRPPAPPIGSVRINALTYGGLHFVQGTFQQISQDGLGGLALRCAFDLMQALLARVKQ